MEPAASGVAGGSDAGGSDAGSLSSLDAVRAMQVVSSRLSSVPEHREIDSPAHRKIDSQDLPEFGALVEARREVDRCLAYQFKGGGERGGLLGARGLCLPGRRRGGSAKKKTHLGHS